MGMVFAALIFVSAAFFVNAWGVISLRQHRINMISGPLGKNRKSGAALFLSNIKAYILKTNNRFAGAGRYAGIKEKLSRLNMDAKYPAGEFIFLEQVCALVSFAVLYAASMDLFVSFVGGIAGFFAPSFVINAKLKKYRENILRELPDAIDIIGANIEGGLSLQKAVERYARRNNGEFASKLFIVVNETGLGKSFGEAMEKLDRDTDIPEVSSFTTAFIQAEKMGGNVKQIIKAQAEDIRNKRFLHLKKKAHEAPVKLLFPLIIFIFPVIFMLLFAPIIIRLLSGGF
jgi:Flp pilus assembly protein TadB